MITWFKLHHDLPDDIKIRRFSPQEKWAWVALLCLASKSKTRGIITADNDDIAEYCEFNATQDWLYYRDKLIGKGMLEIDKDGNLKILHWDDRQYQKPSDRPEAVKARVDKHRKKQKEDTKRDVTRYERESNATDTDTEIRDQNTDPDPEKELYAHTHAIAPNPEPSLSLEPKQNDLKPEPSEPQPEVSSQNPIPVNSVSSEARLIGKDNYSAAPKNISVEKRRDVLADLFSGHRYPELVEVGLGCVVVGRGFNDFDEWTVKACQEYLKACELSSTLGRAKDYLRRLIAERKDWGAVELRWQEGQELKAQAEAADRLRTQAIAASAPDDRQPAETTAEEIERVRIGVQRARQAFMEAQNARQV